MATYRIRSWDSLYENNRTRELKRLDWVPIPNRMDGDGYTELLDHPEGASHLGAWMALVQIASKCDPRGTLVRDGGKSHDFRSLSRISRIPAEVFASALPRFLEIGWVEHVSVREMLNMQDDATIPQEGAGIPQDPDASRARAPEGNGTEGNGRERKTPTAFPASWKSDESYKPFVAAWLEIGTVTGKPLIEEDFAAAHFRWKLMDFEQKLLAVNTTREHITKGVWTEATPVQFIPMPDRYLEREYKRPVVEPKARDSPSSSGARKTKGQEFEEMVDRI